MYICVCMCLSVYIVVCIVRMNHGVRAMPVGIRIHVAIAAMIIVRLCQNLESRSQDYLIKYKRMIATEIRDES